MARSLLAWLLGGTGVLVLYLVVAGRSHSRFYGELATDPDELGIDRLGLIGASAKLVLAITGVGLVIGVLCGVIGLTFLAIGEGIWPAGLLLVVIAAGVAIVTSQWNNDVVRSVLDDPLAQNRSNLVAVCVLVGIVGGLIEANSFKGGRNAFLGFYTVVVLSIACMVVFIFVVRLPDAAAKIGACAASGYPTRELDPPIPGGPLAPHFIADRVRISSLNDSEALTARSSAKEWMLLRNDGGQLFLFDPERKQRVTQPLGDRQIIYAAATELRPVLKPNQMCGWPRPR